MSLRGSEQPNSPVPESYNLDGMPGPLETKDVTDYNEETGMLVLSAHRGDVWSQHNHIATVNGIDHLTFIEFTTEHDEIVVFGDYVLGHHHLSPYKSDE